MARAIFALAVTFVVGVICTAVGNDLLNGFAGIGTIAAVAVMGGFIIFFNEKK